MWIQASEWLLLTLVNLLLPAASPLLGCDPARPALSAEKTLRFPTLEGLHHVIINFPPSYLSGGGYAAFPLVFNFHASGQSARVYHTGLGTENIHEVPEIEGLLSAIVVTPDAGTETSGQRPWNVMLDGASDPTQPDDVAYIRALLDELQTTYCVDVNQVYAAGWSNGARFAAKLACELDCRVAAYAAVAGIRHPRPCSCKASLLVLGLHNLDDHINPYDGGGGPYWQTGVEDAVSGWASHNECGRTESGTLAEMADELAITENMTCLSFFCQSQREVVLVRSAIGMHAWLDGHSRKILRFFQRHQLPEDLAAQSSCTIFNEGSVGVLPATSTFSSTSEQTSTSDPIGQAANLHTGLRTRTISIALILTIAAQ